MNSEGQFNQVAELAILIQCPLLGEELHLKSQMLFQDRTESYSGSAIQWAGHKDPNMIAPATLSSSSMDSEGTPRFM